MKIVKKAAAYTLLFLLICTLTVSSVAAQASAPQLAACNINAAYQVGTVCAIEGTAFEYKGEFNASQFNFTVLEVLSGNYQIRYEVHTLRIEPGNTHIYGIWLEVAPNSKNFWRQALLSIKK